MARRPNVVIAVGAAGEPPVEIGLAAVERRVMGRRIQQLRRRLGLSQAGFAATYGM